MTAMIRRRSLRPTRPSRGTNGSTGFYQIQVSVGPVNLRGGDVTHGDPAINGFVFGPNPSSNQKVPTDNNVAIGSLFYGSPYANVDDPGAWVNDTTVRVVKYDNMQGDTTVTHTQGTLIIASNQINNSLNDGILVSASPREGAIGSPNPNLPHQGSVVNFSPAPNTARLVPGAVIDNNIVNGFGNVGIQFSGDPNAQQPLAAVPFGRIINNTVYGKPTPAGTGIQVTNSASPTIMNNIVANTTTGIFIDASSQGLASPPQLTANLYQNNTANTNLTGGNIGTAGIALQPSAPLFINAPAGNFYLSAGSQAIDSSFTSLQDRAAVTAVTGPLGIAPSPILAPSADINGQLYRRSGVTGGQRPGLESLHRSRGRGAESTYRPRRQPARADRQRRDRPGSASQLPVRGGPEPLRIRRAAQRRNRLGR